ncbi:PadR family transcriptional regulator [Candidatus Gracilibacteria bacterium]|nr:PadR family transcriptional regulator [Candidatus Gracilibacteria bacterium]
MNDTSTIADKFGPIRKGLLELVVLKIIAKEKVYAADILSRLKKTEFTTQEGTLYPLLSRMRREDMVEYEWVESESGPPRKYYQLTARGKAQLKVLLSYWSDLHTTIDTL